MTLEDFCRGVHPRLVGSLTLYCGDRALAEETAQDALAVVIDDWAAFLGKDSPTAWVHTVALNLARSRMRRRRIGRRVTALVGRR